MSTPFPENQQGTRDDPRRWLCRASRCSRLQPSSPEADEAELVLLVRPEEE